MMKRVFIISLLLAAAVPAAVAMQTAATPGLSANNHAVDLPLRRPKQARLVWSEEFSSASLDPNRWRFDTFRNKQGWFNGEKQYYSAGRPENLRITEGKLVIEARQESLSPAEYPDWGGQRYTSSKIMTKGKAAWTYGFFEVRAKLPCARGSWPQIWMMPETGSWPKDGEIDIMEHVGSEPGRIFGTVHTELFVHSKQNARGASKGVPSSCTEFHRYQLQWGPNAITIGVDDRAYMQVRNDQPGGRGAWPFDRPFYMILNLAVGGSWATGGKGISDAEFPQRFEVDYVRVWKLPSK